MSAILSADDLNDFISPGVACIKPIETLPAATANIESDEVVHDGDPAALSAKTNAPPAQISLTDCLACSGCITSAEAVLVSLQSHKEVLHTLDTAPALQVDSATGLLSESSVDLLNCESESQVFIASVAPQVYASMAAAIGHGCTAYEARCMLDQLLRGPQGLRQGGAHHNAFAWMVDITPARNMSLVLGVEETLAKSEDKTSTERKPVLTSSCPGWVCYAEKTHPHVLPYLSTVKSPQAIMGTLLKSTLCRKWEVKPRRIWHLAIMPCFDKKLEASRQELTSEAWVDEASAKSSCGTCSSTSTHHHSPVRDVDVVITTKEILMLAESRGIDFFQLPRTPVDASTDGVSLNPPFPLPDLHNFLFPSQGPSRPSRIEGTSGGNLYYTLRSLQARNSGSVVEVHRGRNSDVVDFSLLSPDGHLLFKASRYYGFRNIQNLVRRLKPAKPSRMPGAKPFGSARRPGRTASHDSAASFVEVMACPGGCTNGGGQWKLDDPAVREYRQQTRPRSSASSVSEKEDYDGDALAGDPVEFVDPKVWLAQVDEAYFSDESSASATPPSSSSSSKAPILFSEADPAIAALEQQIHQVLSSWSAFTGIEPAKLVHTTFREVTSDVGQDKDVSKNERAAQIAGKVDGGW